VGQLFFNGADYYASLIDGITRAKSSIDLETYTLDFDDIGLTILDALKKSSQKGVKIRLLIDGFGSRKSVQKIKTHLLGSGVQVHVFNPVSFTCLILLRKGVSTLNKRNHRKVCIVDSHFAWIGSFNISNVHVPLSSHGGGWRDSALKMTSSEVDLSPLHLAFHQAWATRPLRRSHRFRMLRKANRAHSSSRTLLLNWNGSLRRKRNSKLTEQIKRATQRVWIMSPYFSPNHQLRHALKNAALRGLDVRILLPKAPDVAGMGWVNEVFSGALSRYGVKIFQYQPSVLHAKTVIVDHWALLGSANFNHRSLLYDLEVDVVIHDSKLLRELELKTIEDFRSSKAMPALKMGQKRWWKRALDTIPYALRKLT